MVVRVITLYILLGHVFIGKEPLLILQLYSVYFLSFSMNMYICLTLLFTVAGIGSECIPVQCLMCDTTGETLAGEKKKELTNTSQTSQNAANTANAPEQYVPLNNCF